MMKRKSRTQKIENTRDVIIRLLNSRVETVNETTGKPEECTVFEQIERAITKKLTPVIVTRKEPWPDLHRGKVH